MNIIRWKCGCVQMQDEQIFFAYCEESDYSDYRLRDYIFDVSDRVCEGTFEIVSIPEKLHILGCVVYQSRQAYHFRKFKEVLKDMVK